MKHTVNNTAFSIAKLLWTPHGIQTPLIMSLERQATTARIAGITTHIRNTNGMYVRRFLEFTYKQDSEHPVC